MADIIPFSDFNPDHLKADSYNIYGEAKVMKVHLVYNDGPFLIEYFLQ